MLSDLLRSRLPKDNHDRYKSVGMLSDLMRSGLPNDYPHMSNINPVRKTIAYRVYYPVINLPTYFIEIHVTTSYFTQALHFLRGFEIWWVKSDRCHSRWHCPRGPPGPALIKKKFGMKHNHHFFHVYLALMDNTIVTTNHLTKYDVC